MFTPKWKKEALLLVKGARKFVNYKRDLLKPDRIDEIESRRQDLLEAIKAKDLPKVEAASKQLRGTCENSLKGQQPPSWWEENVEVMFVAIVIALGLRTYVLQPFRIPTGSMQPTLNGIIGKPVLEKDWPALPTRLTESVLRGRSYVKEVAERPLQIQVVKQETGWYCPQLVDTQFLHFFSRSEFQLPGGVLRMPAPASQIYQAGFNDLVDRLIPNSASFVPGMGANLTIPAGSTLCEGTIDAGDLVLVDRVSYHFRKPTRGEVFVFDTRGITGTKQPAKKGHDEDEQADGTHYIKRLAAVPGDKLAIFPPNILINGKVASEPGFEHVYTLPLWDQALNAPSPTVKGYSFAKGRAGAVLTGPGKEIDLKIDTAPGMREYCALGDNSGNSLDSRYWGTVKEFNLVGPALFSLWPITTRHWGFIR
ncbi:signal peptidase I [Luteolibacter ambystomatis]|uniref:Signal peptidase I n=1 Tax=Luteolibacter ambystomatis TaxID=2824561 RepID=A0A975G7S1_9BACT|nr:signal peptidase I [Luteolibacter ambystomatis]QUE50378.1 signal peptidase I [Luteolibacter ambystomatis]